MIKFLLNTLATGFSDEEIILKHERNLRIYLNIKMSLFLWQCLFIGIELTGCPWFLWMK